MDVEKYVSHFVTLSLLVLASWYNNALFAYASVISLGILVAKQVLDARTSHLAVKAILPEDAKRTIQDLNARIATLEYGVKTRGF